MKFHSSNRFVLVSAIVCVLGATAGIALLARENRSTRDRAAIERLHQLDIETTLRDKADELARLCDNDAVRIQPGRPAEIGKAVIYGNDKRWEASTGREKTLRGRSEIQDLQIAGDWAFEWGYFSYKTSTDGKVAIGQGQSVESCPSTTRRLLEIRACNEFPRKTCIRRSSVSPVQMTSSGQRTRVMLLATVRRLYFP
jgi:hypothetical protein